MACAVIETRGRRATVQGATRAAGGDDATAVGASKGGVRALRRLRIPFGSAQADRESACCGDNEESLSSLGEGGREQYQPMRRLIIGGMFEAPVTGSYSLNINASLTSEQQATLEDLALVSALQRAEPEAYEALIRRFQSPVYNLAWRLLDDPADAGDVVQEVFLKVFRSIKSFRGDSTLRTWIYRIAVNEAHNRRRWLFRHRKGETGIEDVYSADDNREAPLVDSGETPFDFTMNHEAQLLLEEALGAVSPAFRTVLILREVEELNYEEIANILDISIGTVKSRLVRGREALRRYLTNRLNPAGSLQLVPGPVK